MPSWNYKRDFNNIGVRSFIPTGAPFPYKTANPCCGGCPAGNNLFQGRLVANNANRVNTQVSGGLPRQRASRQ
jgi:hypothetical protein